MVHYQIGIGRIDECSVLLWFAKYNQYQFYKCYLDQCKRADVHNTVSAQAQWLSDFEQACPSQSSHLKVPSVFNWSKCHWGNDAKGHLLLTKMGSLLKWCFYQSTHKTIQDVKLADPSEYNTRTKTSTESPFESSDPAQVGAFLGFLRHWACYNGNSYDA